MIFLQQIRDWFKPTTVKCADDLETKYEARFIYFNVESCKINSKHISLKENIKFLFSNS